MHLYDLDDTLYRQWREPEKYRCSAGLSVVGNHQQYTAHKSANIRQNQRVRHSAHDIAADVHP